MTITIPDVAANPIIVYHGDCHDGITAAWVCQQRWPGADLYAAMHDVPPEWERLAGRHVVMVDFAWKRPVLEMLARSVASMLILDHHVTTKADLDGFPNTVFDMNRSGAGLAWDVLFPDEDRPELINYVEDRDLWRFSLPGSREIHAACNSYDLTIEDRRLLMAKDVLELLDEGHAILRYHNKLVRSAMRHAKRATIGGYDVPFLVCPSIELISDIGAKLAKGEPFAALELKLADGTSRMSLRSAPDGLDVGEIAKQLGGGGHKHSAGYGIL